MKKEFKFFLNGEYRKELIKTDRYWLTFKDEKEPYLDLQLGYSAFVLGYNYREIFEKINDDYDVQFIRGVTAETNYHVELLKNKLFDLGSWSGISWASSGSDAVESAYTMNQLYWSRVDHKKNQILVFRPNYHGTTFLEKHFRNGDPYLNLCQSLNIEKWTDYQQRSQIENNLLSKVKSTLERSNGLEIGAVLMESIPWLDYLQPWSELFWKSIRKICDDFNVNLIVDDVAGCFGKEGNWFSNDTYGIKPDIIAIGKAFTAGYAPLAAALCNKKIVDVINFAPWNHTHTHYPSMYSVLIALNAMTSIEKFLPNISFVNKKLKEIGSKYNLPTVGDHLLVSYNFKKSLSITDIFSAGLSVCLPMQGFNDSVLKICAPMNADEEYFCELEKRISKFL